MERYNYKMDKDTAQVKLIRKETLKAIGAVLGMYLFALMGVSLADHNYSSWWVGLYIVCFSISCGLLILLLSTKIVRAVYFHSGIFLMMNLPMPLLFFMVATILARNAIDTTPYNLIAINAFSMLFGFTTQIPNERNNLEIAKEYNIKTGRLNFKTGVWDLTKKLHWNSPDKEEFEAKLGKKISRLSYLAPGIGYYLSRNLSDEHSLLFMSFLSYFFASLLAYGSARPFSLILQLSAWEKEIGKRITILSE